MHELSIALNLVEMASRAAAEAGAEAVLALHLRVGALAGVAPDALRFSFELAAKGTPVAGARLEIEQLPVLVRCPACAADLPLPDLRHLCCPRCGRPTGQVVSGRELELIALETP